MASLDVQSLFTNVPVNEAIDITVSQVFKDSDIVSGFKEMDLKSLLKLAAKDIVFVFNGKYYKQIDEVAMGSPLGPTLANSFMAYHERNWLL